MEILNILITSLCTLNIIVSIFLFTREDLELFQKIIQTIIVWLVPFFGGIGFWLFHRSQDQPIKASKGAFGGGPSDSSGGNPSGGD